VVSNVPVPEGTSTVRMDFAYDGAADEHGKGGMATLFINDKPVGSVHIEETVPGRFGILPSASVWIPARWS